MSDVPLQLEEAALKDLEVFVNPSDLRHDLHAFVDYARRSEIKRGHRTNLIPQAHAQRLAKLMSNPAAAGQAEKHGGFPWIEHVDGVCLALKLVQYDTEGSYAGYSSVEPSFPDNYIEMDDARYAKFLALSLAAQEQAILAEHLAGTSGTGNEFFGRGPLTQSDVFDGWGSATGVVPTIPFAKVRQHLLEVLARCPSGVWLRTASLVEYLRQNDPWFLIPKELPAAVLADRSTRGRYGNFIERKRGDWGNRTPISDRDPEGFAKVEGRYIERFLEGLPLVLGYTDVAYLRRKRESEIEPTRGFVAAFRVTERLRRVIRNEIAPPKVTVLPNFEVHVESLFFPAQVEADLRRWSELVGRDVVTVFKLTKAKVAATLAAQPTEKPIEELEALSGRPLPGNVRQELEEWAGHSEKFTLYAGFALLESRLKTVPAATPFRVETISPDFAVVRAPEQLFQALEAAELVPVRIQHSERALLAPPDVKTRVAPAAAGRRSPIKAPLKLKRSVQTTLWFADAEACAAFSTLLLDAKCAVIADSRALTISYPRKAEPVVKECLRQVGQRYQVEIEEIDP